jgi:hypothetical protein
MLEVNTQTVSEFLIVPDYSLAGLQGCGHQKTIRKLCFKYYYSVYYSPSLNHLVTAELPLSYSLEKKRTD